MPDERGVVGFEVLPFLVLVFMVGSLMFAQSWAVLDAKMATTSAARQATRTYVEQPGKSPSDARKRAVQAGEAAIAAHNLPGESSVTPIGVLSLQRCQRATFAATQKVPALRLPLSLNPSPVVVRSQHSEVVDPFRSGLEGQATCVR